VHLSSTERISFVLELAVFLACLMFAATATPQDTSTSSYQSGQPTVTAGAESAEMTYVSGNDVVVKGDNGQVKQFAIADEESMSPKEAAAPDVAPNTLPETGSMIPFIGLLGLLCLGASFTPKYRP
jgi:hypothetical protein